MKKPDFSPLLVDLAHQHGLATKDIKEAINAIAPGAVTQRAVDYWLANRDDKSSRICDSKWIALLAQWLFLTSRIEQQEMRSILNLLQEVAGAYDSLSSNKKRKAPLHEMSSRALDIFDRSMRSTERMGIRADDRHLSPASQTISTAAISVPGL